MYRRAAVRQFSTLKPRQFQFPSRSPPKVAHGQDLRIFRVKFRKPPLRRRILNGLLTWAIPACALWYWIDPRDLEIELSADDEKVKPDGSVEEVNEEDLEDGTFIPFGWPKKEEKTFFKGSEPEWKSFLKLANEPKRQMEIQAKLTKEIRLEVARTIIPLKRQKLLFNKGRTLLTITYPEGPPQNYGVSGVEIGEGFVAWSKKIIPQEEYRRLSKTVMPFAGLRAGWKVISYHYDEQANKVRQYFGLKPKMDPVTMEYKFMLMVHLAAKKKLEQREKKRISPPLVPPISKKEETSTPPSGSKPDPTTSPESGQEKETPPRFSAYFPRADPAPVSTYIFMQNLLKRDETKLDPPAGCVEVKGWIEVVHEQTITTVDVNSNYDLTTNSFVDKTWRVVSFRSKAQRPKGGPG
ncbi:RNA cytidine acetyltransferase [Venturia nashicola]|uniref:RNA cytidine acetyltransferase n=1 Tax=Venturia nashicola TaxID=86259 RepID=A0A4Z1NQ17_9PEZI|nr:RNA cytidine acetyltransferase [Venturia nashicola]TLD24493.1 RNA cytidine acetyltransferase [Venturia nashicola]